MASEEPRPQHDAAETSGRRAASAAPQCSAFSLKEDGGASKYKDPLAADNAVDFQLRESPVHSLMTSIELSAQTAALPLENQADSRATSPADPKAQVAIPKLEVKRETESSYATALSNIPDHVSSPKTQPDGDTVKEEMTSSTDFRSTANEVALISEQSSHPTEIREVSLKSIRDIARSTDLGKLEAGVAAGLAILNDLEAPLQDAKQQDLLDTIANLKKKGKPARTIVSVAGATGAGKSSLINAVLREEKLLPTNGMRACTAVITEISYNYDEDPNHAYRAEVEFISRSDWSSELSILFEELVNDQQLCSTFSDANTEAGIAYAKIRAVYPDLTHEMLVKSKCSQLEGRTAVRNILGTKRSMSFSTAGGLYNALQQYLDSKEKRSRLACKNDDSGFAFWPLIKVVRIFCRADALSTGLCIVDLPGIHDSNAARSAVAKRYMAQCTAVWLASNIKRAVDDKAAKELLGRSSRTQLKMDGIYSNVTFICTCTDDFDINEIQDALDFEGRILKRQHREAKLKTAIAAKPAEISTLDNQVEELESQHTIVDQSLQAWKLISHQHKQGQQVYAPAPIALGPPRKRQKLTARKPATGEPCKQKPLTEDEISKKLHDLEEQSAAKIAEHNELLERLQTAETTLAEMEREKADLGTEIKQICVQLRNQYCKDAIRLDFVAGIREQDEEAGQQDDLTFDPSAKQRDYDEVARSLPVFTISSRAYQQLCATDSKLRAEANGFPSLEDTEIPALQTHAKGMTKTIRVLASRAFLTEFTQLLGTLQIFTNSSDSDILQSGEAGAQARTYEVKVLEKEIGNLKQQAKEDSFKLRTALFHLIRQGPNVKSSDAARFASKRIEEVVAAWHTKKDELVGHYKGLGLPFSTYRAICKRGGAKTRNPKAKDFNEELIEPFMTKISTCWEQTFVKTIPDLLDQFGMMFTKSLQDFHNQAVSRPGLANTRNTTLRMLEQQLPDHGANIFDVVETVKRSIRAEQREASRLFYPEVQKQMRDAYDECGSERGTGCFARMKDTMLSHAQTKKKTLYRKSYRAVTQKIEKSFEVTANELLKELLRICDVMNKNYSTVISCGQMIEASVVAREHLREVLSSVDFQYEAIANEQAMNIEPAGATTSQNVETADDHRSNF